MLDKRFDKVISEIENLKKETNRELEKLRDATGVEKIEQFQRLLLDSIRTNLTNDNYYGNRQWLVLSVENIFRYDENKKDMEKQLEKILGDKPSHGSITKKFSLGNPEGIEEVRTKITELIERLAELDRTTHLANIEIREKNTRTRTVIMQLLSDVGIRKYYMGYKTQRSKNKSEIYYNWSSEISGQIPTSYSDDKIETTKKELLKRINEILDNKKRNIIEEQRKKEEEEKILKDNKIKALLLAKYDLGLEAEWGDILNSVLDRCKYLRLAHSMWLTRGDWGSGYYRVQHNIKGFGIANDVDQKIYEEIYNLAYNSEDIDGRVFRDCEYCYDNLYENFVDSKLYEDYKTVLEYMDIY